MAISHPTSYVRTRATTRSLVARPCPGRAPTATANLAYRSLLNAIVSGRLILTRNDAGYSLQFHHQLPSSPTPRTPLSAPAIFKPRMDAWHDSSHAMLLFELPGVSTQDISIVVQDSYLTIIGERRRPSSFLGSQESSNVSCLSLSTGELRYGRFHRVVPLPSDIQLRDITASMKDGILSVSYPRNGSAAISGTGQPSSPAS